MTNLHPHIPSATYRLQFHAKFRFRDALAILDYLDELGISDIYSSPFFRASPGSTHGYDVANHNAFNRAIGDESDFRQLVAGLRQREMGQVLDFVPNHMGISEALNLWWMEVLEDGSASVYARYFDIDWHPGKEALSDKIVLPILGERYGKVLESGEFKLSFENGGLFLNYFETKLPLNPRTYGQIMQKVFPHLDKKQASKLHEILAIFAAAPEGKNKAKAQLKSLVEHEPDILHAINDALAELQGIVGSASSFDILHELLEKQAYRLCYWRVAAEEINYRRFCDVNTLAAIRVEIPEVFEASHQLVFELLARGEVTGLRIDHIDGLWNPIDYLSRLQERYATIAGIVEEKRPLYIVVEKILDASLDEHLPADWPVYGTTGYEFANQTVHLMIDSAAEDRLTKIYHRFIGHAERFADLVYKKKLLVMEYSFSSEITALGHQLDRLSELDRHYRDFTPNLLTSAVREVIACFPVYRTYATENRPPGEQDERVILRAVSLARRKNPTIEKPVFDFLRNLLLMRFPEGLSDEQRNQYVHFVMKFQQCTSPVMAKGLEDTALYLYHRLDALNEVGGNPGKFGCSIADFHRQNSERHARAPHTLLATSTHDTKRSEDVRMRIAVLSEIPDQWSKTVQRWHRMNRKFLTSLSDEIAPSPNEEYLLYQTLVGTWPLEPLTKESRSEFISRIQEYMVKAIKEGKVNSSWTEPHEEWERAMTNFIEKILDAKSGAIFQKEFTKFAEVIARLGAWNSLSELVLKCTVSGAPDIYQGTEIWDFSLVDPDNRRPVDFEKRRRLLASLSDANMPDLLKDWKSGRIKLFVTKCLLLFRRTHREFFREAN